MPRTSNSGRGRRDLFYAANESYNRTVETGGLAYKKARRKERGAVFVSALYCIAGAYVLMWALIILSGSSLVFVRRAPKVARTGTRTPR